MPLKPTQPFMDRHTYIPPHVQQAMDRHMQQSMPANLRKYTQGNQGYVPRHAELAMAQHMEKAMPPQFKKYAGAYVQQQVMSQNMTAAKTMPQAPPGLTPQAPISYEPQQDHFQPSEQPPLGSPTPVYPPGQPQPAGLQPQTQPYDFIMNPEPPGPRRFKLPGSSALLLRIIYAVGGLFALLIIFIVIKGLISGGSNLPLLLGVAQDQQELIHLATSASRQQQGVSTASQNFAATTQLSIASAQSTLIKYLATNKKKVNPKALNLKVSAAIDTQLTNAAAATTYDQTFQDIMKTKLNTYMNDLQQTYKLTKGKNGRTLLSNDYSQAQLLLTQLNTPAQ